MNFFDNFQKKNLIAAHRGYSNRYPENTRIAFQKALKGSDLLEFDVQFTKDGVAVVFHDETLQRTSNVTLLEEFLDKKPYYVHNFYYEELLKLDIGSWFRKGDIQRILTLDEVLEFAVQNGICLNIEIKDMSSVRDDNMIIKEIVKIIIKYNYEKKVLISSFNHYYLKLMKQFSPSLSIAALTYKDHPKNLVDYLKDLDVNSYHINYSSVSKKIVQSLRKEDIFVGVYTVNQKARQKKLFDMGVRVIFSDCL